MKNSIAATLEKIKKNAHGRATGFVIGNTSDLFTHGRYYETPMRETSEIVYGGVIVRDEKTGEAITRIIDGKVDYVFVDDEKKIRKMYYGPNDVGNIEKAVRRIVKKSKLLTYKGNDLAVEAVDALLGGIVSEVGGITVAIIGMGNLGSKIALKLVERGAYITGFRRDEKKLKSIVDGLNHVKSEYTLSKISYAKDIPAACRSAQVIIGATNEKAVITKDMLQHAASSAVLIDAGKGCFADDVTEDPSFLVYRVDVSIMQKYIFSGFIKAKTHLEKKLGRKTIPELNAILISLGLVGRRGEIIVDDIESPASVIGIAAGNGLLEKNTPRVQKKIEELKKFIKVKQIHK